MSMKSFKPVLFGLVLLVVPLAANAQCYPDCREGFACRDGVCVSPCNPACVGGEVCTREGHCVPSSEPAPLSAVSVTVPAATGTGQPESDRDSKYRQALYHQELNRRSTGAVLTTLGIIGFCGAAVLGGIAGFTGELAFLLIGTGVEAVSACLFIPGVVNLSKGKKGIRRYGPHAKNPYAPSFSLAPTALLVRF